MERLAHLKGLRPDGPIRLIASDFDGTLLPESSPTLDPEVLRMVETLQGEGILFAAASGRRYESLYSLMKSCAKDMFFLAENGCLVYLNGEIISSTPIPTDEVRLLTKAIMEEDGCEVIISGASQAYVIPKTDFSKEFDGHAYTFKIIRDIAEIEEEVIKISAFRPAGIEAVRQKFVDRFADPYHAAVSAYRWQDFTLGNKGHAMEQIMEALAIRPEEVMAFGDNFNDLEMLQIAGTSYAAPQAHSAIKEVSDAIFKTVPQTVAAYLKSRKIQSAQV